MSNENKTMETNIYYKEKQLEILKQQNDAAISQTKALEEQQSSLKANFDTLSDDIEKLKEQNARLKAANQANKQYVKQKESEAAARYESEMNNLMTNKHLTDDEKQKRIQELREEIRRRLEIGLH